MQNSLTLNDPIAFAKAEAERQIGNELDIAHEIYLVRQCASLHYSDLMDDVPYGTASKDMLLAWIRDIKTREGLLTLYFRSRPDHFENGSWQARFFTNFIEFTKDKLTDKNFVGSKQKAQLFANSFANESWRRKAGPVLGLKVMEEMFKRRKLRSRESERVLYQNFAYRDLLQSMTHNVARVAKNNGFRAVDSSDVADIISDNFKRQWLHWKQNPVSESEMKIYERFEFAIEKTMTMLFSPQSYIETAVAIR